MKSLFKLLFVNNYAVSVGDLYVSPSGSHWTVVAVGTEESLRTYVDVQDDDDGRVVHGFALCENNYHNLVRKL